MKHEPMDSALQSLLYTENAAESQYTQGYGESYLTDAVDYLSSEDNDHGNNGNISRFSTDDRRILIRKLLEKRRQSMLLSTTSTSLPNTGEPEALTYPQRSHLDLSIQTSTHENKDADHHKENTTKNNSMNPDEATSTLKSPASNRSYRSYRSRSHSATPSVRHRYVYNDSQQRYAYDDSHLHFHRKEKVEMQIRMEMFKEFTFHPRIKDIPANIYDTIPKDKTSFYSRVMKWQTDRDGKVKVRKIKYDKASLSECTFQPKPTSIPPRAFDNEVTNDYDMDTNDRLYHEYQEIKNSRQSERQHALKLRLELEKQECTFSPQVKSTLGGLYSDIKPKFDKAGERPDYAELRDRLELRGCTFAPKIKGVSESMTSAKLYVSQPVVARLAHPTPITPIAPNVPNGPKPTAQSFDYFNLAGDKPPVDISSFMGSITSRNKRYSTTSVSDKREGKGSTSIGSSHPSTHVDGASFKEFLGRQTQTQLKTKRDIEEIARSSTPGFKPKLCTKSLEMSERNSRGAFLERVERDHLRRVEHEDQAEKQALVDSEGTFQPKLFTRNKLLGRSVYEMSQGDYLKAEQKLRLLKYRTERELLSELTFEPHLSKHSLAYGKSVFDRAKELNSSVSDLYVSTLSNLQKQRGEQEKLRIEQDLAGCTFTPKTTKCPAYIKRIARSVSVSRAAKKAELEKSQIHEKPLWK